MRATIKNKSTALEQTTAEASVGEGHTYIYWRQGLRPKL